MFYLSHLTACPVKEHGFGERDTLVRQPERAPSPLVLPSPDTRTLLQNTVPALYKEYGIETADSDEAEIPLPSSVPVAPGHSAAGLALEAVERLAGLDESIRRSGQYLIYAHDTPEPSFYLTPALLLKKRAGLRQVQPLAISGCGSVSFACAVEMLMCMSAEGDPPGARSIVVVSDQLAPPMPRFWQDHYPYGDAAAACICSPEHGTWEIHDLIIEEWPYLAYQPYAWNEQEIRLHEQLLLERSCTALQRFKDKHSRSFSAIRYALVQHISQAFLHTLSSRLEGISVYKRSYAPACNLLGSDCLISLHELEMRGMILPGETVLLIMAGPLSRVSLMLLRRTEVE
ncbi:hypothetical protein DUZ99_17230 [Xylanibacillus composti]|uniref:Beta-ketoacyl-[acyl-carrier-protein] synthase III C-terminal domain-containing protein n=1 Tax=Xylanibacillus composti TaxID=1572762 RepID=A0A8J4H4G9_9BACL|nr:hypothetical protein [Xylanibacillus composti]MDT9726722.1 hypothetical protein [Xylanibacillus composti]GIQ69346.1 hypothetical protein XYCOK13_21700 [Xylanibacillus composti]